jgi:hypothetical protein
MIIRAILPSKFCLKLKRKFCEKKYFDFETAESTSISKIIIIFWSHLALLLLKIKCFVIIAYMYIFELKIDNTLSFYPTISAPSILMSSSTCWE